MEDQTNAKPEDMFFQLWYKPLAEQGLLSVLNATSLHTLLGLVRFMNKDGSCHPSLGVLGRTLGISNIATVSRRIKKLENIFFQGEPIIAVLRTKAESVDGKLQFTNNQYLINTKIVSIFNPTPTTSIRRKEQMDKFLNDRLKLVSKVSFMQNEKRINKQ